MVLICMAVLGRVFYIQNVQGNYWRALSDSLHQKYVDLSAERGTIYSEDGNMLSTSVPYFNIYIDFDAEGLREKKGKRFKENLDSLSFCLANLFRDSQQQHIKNNCCRDTGKLIAIISFIAIFLLINTNDSEHFHWCGKEEIKADL